MQVTQRPTPIASSSLVWLFAALAPVVTALLVSWAERAPDIEPSDLTSLAGTWEAAHVGAPAAWQPAPLPGPLPRQQQRGVPEEVRLRRTFEAPPGVVGRDAAFVFQNMHGVHLTVFVNGAEAALQGSREPTRAGMEASAEVYRVPDGVLRKGENEITLLARTSVGGITDARLYFGEFEGLVSWAAQHRLRRASVLNFSLGVISVLVALVLALRLLEGRRDHHLHRATLLLLGAGGFYLARKAGYVVPLAASGALQMVLISISVFFVQLALVEFVEAYFLRRATRFRLFNRGVVALATVSCLFEPAVYRVFTVYLFGTAVYGLVVGMRGVLKKSTSFGPLVAVATLMVIAAGVVDLLGDLEVLHLPRLFALAIANLAAMSGAVVVAEFAQLAGENERLSQSLTQRATELAEALAAAREASRVKSEFLANTSHELRTPLNAIINIPQGLLEHFHDRRELRCGACATRFVLEEGEVTPAAEHACPACGATSLALERGLAMQLAPEETARLLKSIVRSGSHLLAVVNDILDYSKLEAGRVVLHKETVSVTALLEELRQTMEPGATLAGVALRVEAHGADGVALVADRVKLSQVLINLIGNAIKFSDGRGTVTVRAEVSPGQLTLSVKDEGIGIAPEHQALIFDGFRQVEGSNTRRFGGSGLGLAISKTLVALHDGALRVSSRPGEGSTFFVELPLGARGDEATRADEDVIVVIDDEASAIDTVTVALAPLGRRLVAVTDPRDALARLRATRPSLVVLDVMMPRVSGLELLRQLKAAPDLVRVPVLVSSAYPDNEHAALALGASFISKPWHAGELLRVVSGLLAQQGPATALRPPSAS